MDPARSVADRGPILMKLANAMMVLTSDGWIPISVYSFAGGDDSGVASQDSGGDGEPAPFFVTGDFDASQIHRLQVSGSDGTSRFLYTLTLVDPSGDGQRTAEFEILGGRFYVMGDVGPSFLY